MAGRANRRTGQRATRDDDAELCEHLLAGLRVSTGRTTLSYAEPPSHFATGGEASIHAFRLAGAPPALAGPLVLRLRPG